MTCIISSLNRIKQPKMEFITFTSDFRRVFIMNRFSLDKKNTFPHFLGKETSLKVSSAQTDNI